MGEAVEETKNDTAETVTEEKAQELVDSGEAQPGPEATADGGDKPAEDAKAE